MNYAWMCPVPLEKAVVRDPGMIGMLSLTGDSMVFVSKYGRRVVNECPALDAAPTRPQVPRGAKRWLSPDRR